MRTYHIQRLKQLENFLLGALEEIKSVLSVRRIDHGRGQAVDLARVQTYMQMLKL